MALAVFLPMSVRKALYVRITAKGQVTIPQDVREQAGLMPGTDVAFEIEAGVVRLVKTTGGARQTRGQRLVESLRAQGDFKMTTDEVVALMRGPAADEG
jgi:AbrB family looped-hinge helix DNA binding protein